MGEAVTVLFGRHEYKLPSSEVTGGELRRLFGVPPTDDLFIAQGNKAVGDPLRDDQVITVKNGEHFTSAPKHVTFGER